MNSDKRKEVQLSLQILSDLVGHEYAIDIATGDVTHAAFRHEPPARSLALSADTVEACTSIALRELNSITHSDVHGIDKAHVFDRLMRATQEQKRMVERLRVMVAAGVIRFKDRTRSVQPDD